ncbi:phage BR0599 family protein [uncultured Sulfitobacter sp.]|uniref:phage BR0599 family protein n=1 Tax=uncultured Sulfitobacter sp. TaxID=191468 RepID=UPI002595A9E9|nr:phage BR0599 family protein [uncultured Sulfitobacter sp.]
MSFAEQETSEDGGQPDTLFLFRFGTSGTALHAYTDAEDSIDHYDPLLQQTITYEPIPIGGDAVKSSGNLDHAGLVLKTPQDSDLAERFKFYPPSELVTLTMRQGHSTDVAEQFLVNWTGKVIGFKVVGEQAEFVCEHIITALKRNGLRRNYQYGCPHVLYGNMCGADKAAASSNHVVQSTDGPFITLLAGWTTDALKAKHVNGMAEWQAADGRTEIRTILRAETDGTILLSGEASDLDTGETVTLRYGCSHLMPDCRDLHNNILNYGGQPFIPTKNPIGFRNIYY